MTRVFIPSSIAVFGPQTPKENTPQETILKPTTMYGVSKVAGELLGDYYVQKFGLDVRGMRYPGIISSETLPGGGTTDYAVEIFYEAIKNKRYTCFVKEATKLKHHCDYNVTAMSFSAGELAKEITKHIPEFTCTYKPDFRQDIADSWPQSIDDSCAREEWNWKHSFDLSKMTKDMIKALGKRHEQGKLYG